MHGIRRYNVKNTKNKKVKKNLNKKKKKELPWSWCFFTATEHWLREQQNWDLKLGPHYSDSPLTGLCSTMKIFNIHKNHYTPSSSVFSPLWASPSTLTNFHVVFWMSTSKPVAISTHLSLYPYKGLYTQLKYKCFTYYPHNYHSSCVRVRIKLILSNFLENKTKATTNMYVCWMNTEKGWERATPQVNTREGWRGQKKKKML